MGAVSSAVHEVVNPATEEIVTTVELTSLEQTDAAIERAARAFPAWRAVAGRDPAPGREGTGRALDRGVRLLERGELDGGDDLLGGRIDDLVDGAAHSRSKPRTLSQSVTALSKAASSTRAAFV